LRVKKVTVLLFSAILCVYPQIATKNGGVMSGFHVVLLARMFVLKDSLCPPYITKPLAAPHKVKLAIPAHFFT
jgi:hypothetical protein